MKKHNILLSSSSITKDSVRNTDGEDLGNIKDLMINTETGYIEYAVLSFGGFLGLGDKYFAIPWQTLRLDAKNECLVLNVNKETLKNAPGFDKDNWPDFSDERFHQSIHNHYGLRYQRAA